MERDTSGKQTFVVKVRNTQTGILGDTAFSPSLLPYFHPPSIPSCSTHPSSVCFFFLHEWADTHIFSYFLSYVKDSILSIFFCIFTSSVTICLQKSYHTFNHRAPPHWPSTVCLYHSSFQYPLIPICFLSFVTFKMLSWITMCILRFGEVYLQGKFLDMRLRSWK